MAGIVSAVILFIRTEDFPANAPVVAALVQRPCKDDLAKREVSRRSVGRSGGTHFLGYCVLYILVSFWNGLTCRKTVAQTQKDGIDLSLE